ncbi:MAG TPA: isoprenylcysteine carboxylmethyltransferase family protein [Candidatus Limnocylindrales bacterium]|nr:isoprenylcysteine carboxylmethyltransferase family protein [Candidatus Limnocylindrales bacterium]
MKPSARIVTIVPIVGITAMLFLLPPPRWTTMRLAGLVLLIPSLFLLTLARLQLGDAFSVTPQATTLITHGLYSRIRNPIYLFGSCVVAGIILYLEKPWFLLALIPLLALQMTRARQESKVLEARFGEDYRQYRSRTRF